MHLIDNKFLFLRSCFCFMIEQFCLPKLNIYLFAEEIKIYWLEKD